MATAHPKKRRHEPSFQDILAEHSDIPRLLALRMDVQRRGVHYTPATGNHIDPLRHQLRTVPTPHTAHPHPLIPHALLLRDGSAVVADAVAAESTPYCVDIDAGQLVLKQEDEVVEAISLWPRPDYYAQRSASGVPLEQLVAASTQRLDVVAARFHTADAGQPDSTAAAVPTDAGSAAQAGALSRQELQAAIAQALQEPGRFTSIALLGRTQPLEDSALTQEVDAYIATLQAIGSSFRAGKFPSQLIAAALPEPQLIRLYEQTGLTRYTANLGVADETRFQHRYPFTARRLGYREWRRRLIAAVGIFGRGQVTTTLIAGQELVHRPGIKREREALDATLAEAELLAEHGVVTLAHLPTPYTQPALRAQQTPSLDYYLRLASGLQRIRHHYRLEGTLHDDLRRGSHADPSPVFPF